MLAAVADRWRSCLCLQMLLLLLLQLPPQAAAIAAKAVTVGGVGGGSGGSHLPDGLSPEGKLKAFLVCRKDCVAKCDRLVYVYSAKKEYCHECLKQCISSVVQQARSLGIDFNSVSDCAEERMQGDSPASGRQRRRRHRGQPDQRRRRDERERRRRRNRKRRREAADRERQQKQQKQQKPERQLRREKRALLKNCIAT